MSRRVSCVRGRSPRRSKSVMPQPGSLRAFSSLSSLPYTSACGAQRAWHQASYAPVPHDRGLLRTVYSRLAPVTVVLWQQACPSARRRQSAFAGLAPDPCRGAWANNVGVPAAHPGAVASSPVCLPQLAGGGHILVLGGRLPDVADVQI